MENKLHENLDQSAQHHNGRAQIIDSTDVRVALWILNQLEEHFQRAYDDVMDKRVDEVEEEIRIATGSKWTDRYGTSV